MTSRLPPSFRRNMLCLPVRREIALTFLALGVCHCGDAFVPVPPSFDDDGSSTTPPFDAGAVVPDAGPPDNSVVPDAATAVADATVDDAQATADAADEAEASGSADADAASAAA